MLGVALFQMFLSRGSYRKAFCTTLILKLVASLFDLFIINRENIKLGIPDKVAFILGDASTCEEIPMPQYIFSI
jgi:BT1 family